eukprot:1406786-Prorocentrum_lima.AAC.1
MVHWMRRPGTEPCQSCTGCSRSSRSTRMVDASRSPPHSQHVYLTCAWVLGGPPRIEGRRWRS